jgi:hypothetical protein
MLQFSISRDSLQGCSSPATYQVIENIFDDNNKITPTASEEQLISIVKLLYLLHTDNNTQ